MLFGWLARYYPMDLMVFPVYVMKPPYSIVGPAACISIEYPYPFSVVTDITPDDTVASRVLPSESACGPSSDTLLAIASDPME